MAKKIAGYVRNIADGSGVSGKDCTIRHKASGSAVSAGGTIGADANPVTTSASPAGYFEWNTELSPGPIYVECEISATETKIRSGDELMQQGEVFVSDQEEWFLFMNNGVMDGVLNEFDATPGVSGREVTIDTGRSIIEGLIWGLDTTRLLAHDAEAALTERYDLIVQQQYVDGTEAGRQDLVILKGTVNQTDPTLNSDPEIFEVALYRAHIPLGASVVTLDSLRTNTSPKLALPLTGGTLTGALTITKSASTVFLIEQDGGTDVFRVDSATPLVDIDGRLTVNSSNAQALVVYPDGVNPHIVIDMANDELELWHGTKIRGFSNGGVNETWSIDSANGNAQFDGTLGATGAATLGSLTSASNVIVQSGSLALHNTVGIFGYSNAGSTETWSITSAAGNAQFDGTLSVDGNATFAGDIIIDPAAFAAVSLTVPANNVLALVNDVLRIDSDSSIAFQVRSADGTSTLFTIDNAAPTQVAVNTDLQISGAINHDGSTVGFYGATPATKQEVTGSRGGNAALADLLTELAEIGLITDSTTA